MKKILLGLIATVLFGFYGNAQDISNEDARSYAAKVMVEFKNSLFQEFSSSKNFDEFVKNSTGSNYSQGQITSEGLEMLKTAYGFLSKKTSDEEIITTYSGIEIAKAFKWLKENRDKDEGMLFGIKSLNSINVGGKGGPSLDIERIVFADNYNLRCCFFCLRCHLSTVFGPDGADKIIDAVVDAIIALITK